MVGYILVYPQNITSIDAESGASCDTTALKSLLSGGDLMEADQTPSGHLVHAPWAAALPPYILPFVGVGGADRSSSLSALDATSFSLDHHPRCQCGCTALLPFAVRWVSYVPRTPAKSRLLRTGPFFHLHFVIKSITLLVCQMSMPSKFHLPGAKRNT